MSNTSTTLRADSVLFPPSSLGLSLGGAPSVTTLDKKARKVHINPAATSSPHSKKRSTHRSVPHLRSLLPADLLLLVVEQVVIDDKLLARLPLVEAVVVDGDHVQLELSLARVVRLSELHVRQQLNEKPI